MSVHPAETQISLGIRTVWSESSLSAWRKLGSLATHWAHSEDSDQTGRMPRLICPRWAHIHFVGFVMRWFIYSAIPFLNLQIYNTVTANFGWHFQYFLASSDSVAVLSYSQIKLVKLVNQLSLVIRKPVFGGLQPGYDSNRSAQLQKLPRVLKCWHM